MSDLLREHIEKVVLLTDSEFEFVSSCFVIKRLRKHQFLIQEGDEVNNMYFVLKGCLKAYCLDIDGNEYILQFAEEDWWVSDFQAYFTRAKAFLNIDCIEDSEFLVLSYENFENICAQSHKMEHFFRVKANLGYIALQQRILSFLSSNSRERYEQFSTLYPSLLKRIPKRLIASYLGVSRETLSRLNVKMR